jgi:hypothetical protein
MSLRQLKEAWKKKLMIANVRSFFAGWKPQKVRSFLSLRPQLEYAQEYERQKTRDNVSEILD